MAANTHQTLTSLFSDIADSIRIVQGGTEAIVADEFPTYIKNLFRPMATQWSSKLEKILTPTLSTIDAAITIKAMCYYDGYWYGVGNDSAGNAYKLYGTTTGNLTAYILGSNRNYPVTGIACDGTYVWISCGLGSYSNRILLHQSIADFRSSSTLLQVYARTDIYNTDICRIDDTHTFVFGSTSDGTAATMGRITNGNIETFLSTIYDKVPESIISGCVFNNTVVAITNNGYLMQWDTPSSSVDEEYRHAYHKQFDTIRNCQLCRQMGDYFCIAWTLNNQTYLSFTNENQVCNAFMTNLVIADEPLTIVGMAYAGGIYTVVGYNSNGETKVWQTTDLTITGVYGHKIALTDGYIPRTMATDGTNICILADKNGASVQKALATIS